MGLFRKDLTYVCVNCGASYVLSLPSRTIREGPICGTCFEKTGSQLTKDDTLETTREKIRFFEHYHSFDCIKEWIFVNEETREWFYCLGSIRFAFEYETPPTIYSMDNVYQPWAECGYRTISSITPGSPKGNGVGRAVAGGILAGSTGAIVGAATAKPAQQPTVQSSSTPDCKIFFYTKNEAGERNLEVLKICNNEITYTLLSMLESWAAKNDPQPEQAETAVSAADELRKFKGLLDDGIISQEEFEAKKKQLLGL